MTGRQRSDHLKVFESSSHLGNIYRLYH